MSQTAPPSSPLNRPIRLAVLISGGGTTLVNFADQIADGRMHAEIPLVIASRPDCGGVERARERGLKCEVLSRKDYRDVHTYSAAVFAQCRDAQADLVVLAGFLSLLEIPDDFSLRVMNIHPALIPAFCGGGYYGHHVHEAVLARGLKISGCTAHFADNEYDHGPIIVQKCVPVLDDDNPTTLAARVFEAECQAYPEAIRLFAEGRLEVSGRHVRVHAAQ
jgi:formyltetrahydrofolate-dependent phosphoribosylglycinamide formyltransferase